MDSKIQAGKSMNAFWVDGWLPQADLPRATYSAFVDDHVVSLHGSTSALWHELSHLKLAVQDQHRVAWSYNYDAIIGGIDELHIGQLNNVFRQANALKRGADRIAWWAKKTETSYGVLADAFDSSLEQLQLLVDPSVLTTGVDFTPYHFGHRSAPVSTNDFSEYISSSCSAFLREPHYLGGSFVRVLELFQKLARAHELAKQLVAFVTERVTAFLACLFTAVATLIACLKDLIPNRSVRTMQHAWFVSVVEHPPHLDALAIEFPILGSSARACSIPSIA